MGNLQGEKGCSSMSMSYDEYGSGNKYNKNREEIVFLTIVSVFVFVVLTACWINIWSG